ncbi:MAG: hypothetical protein KBG15_03790 [Kofleriaceae bacterium]|nr:hypothetical protein [Kofleriaceae bacterium]
MKRTLMLFGLSAPLLIGGWVFAGDNRPVPPAPAAAPAKSARPAPAAPPAPPHVGAAGADPWTGPNGISIKFEGLDQIKAQVTAEVARARAEIAADMSLPADVRAAVLARMDKVTAVIERRIAKLNLSDLMNLDTQLEGLGDEIEKSMAGLEQEIKLFEKKYGRSFGKTIQASKGHFNLNLGGDDDDDADDDDNDADDDDNDADADSATVDMSAAADLDSDNLDDAVDDITDMGIDGNQRTQLSALRSAEQATTKAARERMRQASAGLRTELAKPAADLAVVNRYIDQISAEEATVRKAQLKALVAAKTVLTAAQQKKVQDAAAKAKGKTK